MTSVNNQTQPEMPIPIDILLFSLDQSLAGAYLGYLLYNYDGVIHLLGNWHVIPVLIIILALAQCAAAWAIGIGFIALQDIALLHKANMFARTIIWLGGAALADVIIALSMLYLVILIKE
ncbi:hypothetical protein C8R42DRAFT_646380 [Lentinula raphanica]|nr:hypothetical protein C8R42DRAFT_646380 [Lentinula raphanica]